MRTINSDERYQELAKKWLNNTISGEEEGEFAKWYNNEQDKEINLPKTFARSEDALKNRIFSVINEQITPNAHIKIALLRRRITAAAVILIVFSSALYFYSNGKKLEYLASKVSKKSEAVKPQMKESSSSEDEHRLLKGDIPAGNDKAILTLEDGTKIIIDDAEKGILANQGGNSISKTAAGELIYSYSKKNLNLSSDNSEKSFHKIETPKGGKIQVKLPDGSRVWLNAASSLRFSASFLKGSKRKVELTGEAYFEVAHDPTMIFEVATRYQTVQVLGTHFNINAYSDEPSITTTLLEGSVKISDLRSNTSQLLKPGEQAKFGEKIEIVNVKNTAGMVAWKEGYFQFDDADIQTVMRQIERWYDVKVRYEDEINAAQHFGGEIQRSLSLLQVLKILEKAEIHFRLEGREVIVMK